MLLETILLFLTVLLLFYVYITKHFGYFKSKGIPELPGSFPFGSENSKQMVTQKISPFELLDAPAEQFKGRINITTNGLSVTNGANHIKPGA